MDSVKPGRKVALVFLNRDAYQKKEGTMFMRLWSLAIALLLSASLQSAQAAEFDSKEVKRLTAANFDGFLSSSEVSHLTSKGLSGKSVGVSQRKV